MCAIATGHPIRRHLFLSPVRCAKHSVRAIVTHAIDDSTILFTMTDGKIWKNSLKAPCSQLQFRDSFTYDEFGGTICANQQRIRVLDAPSGAPVLRNPGPSCQLGDFSLQSQ